MRISSAQLPIILPSRDSIRIILKHHVVVIGLLDEGVVSFVREESHVLTEAQYKNHLARRNPYDHHALRPDD